MWKNLIIITWGIACCCCLEACSSEYENENSRETEESDLGPEIAMQCIRQSANSLTITYIPGMEAVGYYCNEGPDPYSGTKIDNGRERSITYTNLVSNSKYFFTAVAWNKKGKKGIITTLYTQTKDDKFTNYFTLDAQKYELLNANMFVTVNWQGGDNYKVLCFEGENGITINLKEKSPQPIVPYPGKWKAGVYSVGYPQEQQVYTCSVNLFSQKSFVDGTISLYYGNDNQLSASFNCGSLQGYYKGKYTF